jgi:hypothetical protein
MIGAGIMLPVMLKKIIPGKSPVIILNGVILYYIIFYFLLRWMLQGNTCAGC